LDLLFIKSMNIDMPVKAITVREIQTLDKIAISRLGIPSIILMENAGRGVTHEVQKALKSKKTPRVCVVCGLGNNAGDGFVVARHLLEAGIKTQVFCIGSGQRLKGDAKLNYQILKSLKYRVSQIKGVTPTLKKALDECDVIVDAIFGVGLNRKILNPFRAIIEQINASKKRTISVDTPSGLDGTTGRIYGVCVKATTTVTFSFIKKGFLKNKGRRYTGKVVVVDIGIPKRLLKNV